MWSFIIEEVIKLSIRFPIYCLYNLFVLQFGVPFISKMATKFSDVIKELKGLNIDKKQHINILLLGGTGIGKSTFVNALANYLSYKSLKDAEKEKLMVLIPARICIRDKNNKDHVFTVGCDKNEYLEVGASATQDVRTYVFPIGNGDTKLRIIDSPGIGDTRGIEQDGKNCENILSYLGHLDELHAICCMFQTMNARSTTFFEYCFKEILTRLDKSACENLVFIFTNSRAAHYSPGETLSVLRGLAQEIQSQPPYAKIPLEGNVFCFENDSFKYLAARKRNIEFEGETVKNYKESWRISARESWKLISYIVGDDETKPLRPHDIRNTISINEARRLIVNLSQPLADISQLIQDNLIILDRHKQQLSIQNDSVDELKRKLYIPVVNLKVTTLTQPVTVCTSSKCTEIYVVGTVQKKHYRQRCHDPCYLTNVPKELIGASELVNCAAIDRSTKSCTKCTCDFSIHMHIYYEAKTVDETIEDDVVKNNIHTRQQALIQTRKTIDIIEARKQLYEAEQKEIIKHTAQFAHFLQHNAITPINDSYEQYIKYMIERERSLGRNADLDNLKQLNYFLSQYREMKRSFDTALSMQKTLGSEINLGITPKKIFESIQKLYSLPHTGRKIRELVDSQKIARSQEHKETQEYIHASPANMFADVGIKKSKHSKSDREGGKYDSDHKKGQKRNDDKKYQSDGDRRARQNTNMHGGGRNAQGNFSNRPRNFNNQQNPRGQNNNQQFQRNPHCPRSNSVGYQQDNSRPPPYEQVNYSQGQYQPQHQIPPLPHGHVPPPHNQAVPPLHNQAVPPPHYQHGAAPHTGGNTNVHLIVQSQPGCNIPNCRDPHCKQASGSNYQSPKCSCPDCLHPSGYNAGPNFQQQHFHGHGPHSYGQGQHSYGQGQPSYGHGQPSYGHGQHPYSQGQHPSGQGPNYHQPPHQSNVHQGQPIYQQGGAQRRHFSGGNNYRDNRGHSRGRGQNRNLRVEKSKFKKDSTKPSKKTTSKRCSDSESSDSSSSTD